MEGRVDWRWRKETWTLSQTGNWLAHNVGTNSSANNALVETGTFNTANEWTGRSRTVPGTASDTLVYDKVGNMVNDGKGLAYKYDGLGRLREVRLTGESNRLKTAYRYNGLGMRTTHAINMSEGTSDDDVTDAGDPVTYFAYDERWRVAGAWVSSANTTPGSSTPTERWIHHAAGIGGRGGSSYIDSVILRDRDVVTSGGSATSTSDGGSDALEERIYVLQNWRADVVATVGRTGTLIEWMQYTAYGSAITNPPGNADFNGDGDVDASDTSAFFDAFTAGLLSADVNNDGAVTGDDVEAFDEIWDAGLNPEPGVCVFTAIRIGYAGYQWDGSVNVASARKYTGAMAGLYHVRHRVYDPEMGRWTRRDPIGYVDGMGLYQYVAAQAVRSLDPSGLVRYRTYIDCLSSNVQRYYKLRTDKPDGSCGRALTSEMSSCCQAYVFRGGSANAFNVCRSLAVANWNSCATPLVITPPPPPPNPYNPNLPPVPPFHQTLDCTDACTRVAGIVVSLCLSKKTTKILNCQAKGQALSIACIACCSDKSGTNGAHDCATETWYEFWADQLGLPLFGGVQNTTSQGTVAMTSLATM